MELTKQIETERSKLSRLIMDSDIDAKKLNLDYELIDEIMFYALELVNAPDEETIYAVVWDLINCRVSE